ncbi:HD domain-containing protein [Streptomyces sp. TLI_171]|uniref:HD domain-containing protein n=1 Tax=Streptomyces sp. TLI_171 TaxID=1938859 RepID=UPI000C195EB6|nr:HD domain-containing protein [Streptomyces sp. TLI_171]RKE17179.1 HD domain-containing protein [Streptomyces sp. TLI_171]
MPHLTLAEVDALAARAHAGQHDRIGVPYVEHVRAVAAGLAPFGAGLRMAALLHDVLEDTPTTAEDLLAAGVPAAVVATVRRVTRQPGAEYAAMLGEIVADQAATLVKIADNAHNSRADRAAQLPEADRARLAERYRAARAVLWPAAAAEDVRTIVAIVNPGLLAELD